MASKWRWSEFVPAVALDAAQCDPMWDLRDERIWTLHGLGYSQRQIARAVGMTAPAIGKILRRLKAEVEANGEPEPRRPIG